MRTDQRIVEVPATTVVMTTNYCEHCEYFDTVSENVENHERREHPDPVPTSVLVSGVGLVLLGSVEESDRFLETQVRNCDRNADSCLASWTGPGWYVLDNSNHLDTYDECEDRIWFYLFPVAAWVRDQQTEMMRIKKTLSSIKKFLEEKK